MDSNQIVWWIVAGVVVLFLLWNIRSFFVRIGGRWYEQKDATAPAQEILLSQLGPFVWGEASVKGGILRYSGRFNGKQLRLTRKDHGREYLSGLGFPDSVLGELDGSEMARIEFVYDNQRQTLEGQHFPQKIEISQTRPPRIAKRVYIAPQPRRWTRQRPKQAPDSASSSPS